MSDPFKQPATYHSGENNQTTGREPFEDTSRDFIHGGNTHAQGTGIPGTFGAGVGGQQTTHHTGQGLTGATAGSGLGQHTSTTHHTGEGLTGATAGSGLGQHTSTTGRHGLDRRGSSSSSSSSEEEVDGVRRKKDKKNRTKKPIGEKVKEAVGLGGAGAAAGGVAGSHQGQHDSRGIAPGTAGVTGVHQGASHGLTSLHGQRDEFNENATRGDIRSGTSSDPNYSSGVGGLSGATRQTGDVPGGIQSGTTSYGTGHNLASEARDHTTGSHHTGTGVGSGVGAGLAGVGAGTHYGSNTAASDYSSTTGVGHSTGGIGQSTGGGGIGSGLGHSGIGEDRSTGGIGHSTGGIGSGVGHSTGGIGSGVGHSGIGEDRSTGGIGHSTGGVGHSSGGIGSGIGEDRSAGYARNQGGPGNEGITGHNLSGAAGTDRFDVDRASSGAHTGSGTGIGSGHNVDSGVGRHGVTGDFDNNATAPTGGAYSNPDAKTGLTGREHTTTGAPDQHGHSTEQHSGGLLDKVKGILGGHSATK